MPREDLKNVVAAAKFAVIQGGRRPVGCDGRQAKAKCRFQEENAYLEDSDDVKVGVTELQEQLEISEN